MTETIGVLVIFFFLLMLGFRFYTNFQVASIEEKNQEIAAQRAVQIALTTSSLPEVQCSVGTEFEAVEKTDCLDLLKVKAFEKLASNSEHNLYYYDILSSSNIIVDVIYPDKTSLSTNFYDKYGMVEEDWPITLYSNIPKKYSSKIRTDFPVLLMDTITDVPNTKFYFGILTVEVYR